jgi:3-phenylpropionate/cinnamic acid dioxygenase small subunit
MTEHTAPDVQIPAAALAAMYTQFEVERFLYDEAAMLDSLRFADWLELFADDIHYFMPLRRTVSRRQMDLQFTKPGEIAWFDDTKAVLAGRVSKLATGTSWSEDPPSRTRHLVTNVRVVANDGIELQVESNFHIYRTRLKSEEQEWIGSRQDVLRRNDNRFLIARRTILLEQTVLLTSNLTTFF